MSLNLITQGQFIPFYLPFTKSDTDQALSILDTALMFDAETSPSGTAITYSANYGQTTTIAKTYAAGLWKTNTGGANQASVMTQMENQLSSPEYQSLQMKMRIAPITTIPPDMHDEAAWMLILQQDIANIKALLDSGWVVLGWINQNSKPQYAHALNNPNGVVKSFPAGITKYIQDSLNNFALQYPRIAPAK